MAFSAHRDDRMMEELREPPEVVRAKAHELAGLIRSSRHVVVFTGAGISTAAGIADYRGPEGVWTLEARGEAHRIRSAEMVSAVPTTTHMAIVELMRRDMLHHVISQNVDGLHRKSGVPREQISELHGNSSVEYCTSCRREYLRDYRVQAESSSAREHQTGRRCVARGCGGLLHDNIINFGEPLPQEVVMQGFAHAERADLHIVMGSSLTVAPASDMPRATKRQGGKLVIVNLQRTAQDSQADLRAHCSVNDLMSCLMEALSLPVPRFRLLRGAAVWRTAEGGICCAGQDPSERPPHPPVTLFRRCAVAADGGKEQVVEGESDALILAAPDVCASERGAVRVQCEFYGHYQEPAVELELPQGCDLRRFWLSLDPLSDTAWTVEHADAGDPPSADDILPGQGGAATAAVQRAVVDKQQIQDDTDYSGWFAVQPVDDCPHTASGIGQVDQLCFDARAPCATCGNVGENMLCLCCHEVHCGRHVKQHMLAHREATGHPLVCGFIDLSFWCYECDEYISPSNPRLAPYYAGLHTAKFGVPPPRFSGDVGMQAIPEE